VGLLEEDVGVEVHAVRPGYRSRLGVHADLGKESRIPKGDKESAGSKIDGSRSTTPSEPSMKVRAST
jgi:hypothetical protein